MLKIHEETTATGELAATFLRFEDGVLAIVDAGGAVALPDGALAAAMLRFGAPFDPEADVAAVARLALDQGRGLRHVRHLAGYDVIARDYLVYETPDGEPLCALATTIAAALADVARVGATRPR